MLGQEIRDPEGVEGGGVLRGIGLLPHSTVFYGEKTRTRVEGRFAHCEGIFAGLEGIPFCGYEIHMGVSQAPGAPALTMRDQAGTEKSDGLSRNNVFGCYIHGLFDNGESAAGLVNCLLRAKGLTEQTAAVDWADYAQQQFDLLAQGLRESLDMKAVYRILNRED